MTNCKYCMENSDGYIRALDNNGHAHIFLSHTPKKHKVLHIRYCGKTLEIPINFCPICGREFTDSNLYDIYKE